MKMYVIMNRKRNGPHDPDAVKALYESGQVTGDDLAWKAGMNDWKPLKELFPDWFEDSDKLSMPLPSMQLSAPVECPSTTSEKASDSKSADNAPEPNDEEHQAVTSGKDAISPDTDSDVPVMPAEEPVEPPPEKLYLGIAGEKRGPLSPDETTALLTSGEIDLDCLAWKRGMAGWKPLREVWPDCEKITTDPTPDEEPPPISLLDKLQSAFRQNP